MYAQIWTGDFLADFLNFWAIFQTFGRFFKLLGDFQAFGRFFILLGDFLRVHLVTLAQQMRRHKLIEGR
jgi:hypothetical protein